MPRGRGWLCALLALVCALALAGCGGIEGAGSGASPATVAGVGAGQGEELEAALGSEDDEAELKEIVDRETTPEERQELREGLEAGGRSEAAGEQEAPEREEPEREEAQ